MKILLILLFLCFNAFVSSQTFDEILIEKYRWEVGKTGIDLERYFKFRNLYSESISLASEKYSIPVELIEAVITVESNWNPNSKGTDNCNGLMQIQCGTFEPHKNIMNGTGILKHYLIKCKNDTAKALTAFNRGYSGMLRYYKRYGHASNYSKKVLSVYQLIKKIRKGN